MFFWLFIGRFHSFINFFYALGREFSWIIVLGTQKFLYVVWVSSKLILWKLFIRNIPDKFPYKYATIRRTTISMGNTYHQLWDSHTATFYNNVPALPPDVAICMISYPPALAVALSDRVMSRHDVHSGETRKR